MEQLVSFFFSLSFFPRLFGGILLICDYLIRLLLEFPFSHSGFRSLFSLSLFLGILF